MTREEILLNWLAVFGYYLLCGVNLAAMLLWFAFYDAELRKEMTLKQTLLAAAVITGTWPYFGWLVVRRLPKAIQKIRQGEWR